MDYDLARIDYTVCGITYPDTLKIMSPLGPKVDQKVKYLLTTGTSGGPLST